VEEQQADSGAGEKIDWGLIGGELNRSTKMCKNKWGNYQRSLRNKSLEKGPYSPQEDARRDHYREGGGMGHEQAGAVERAGEGNGAVQ
jgi:hypothetical protein